MKTSGNPQGKGLVPVLDAWRDAQPAVVAAKSRPQILADYFTTMLVLSAKFAFKPRPDVTYYLYRATDEWLLSLVSPVDWGERAPGVYLGSCQLLPDMTWRLQPRDDLESESKLISALLDFHDGFVDELQRATTLEDGLPFYVAGLPYYQRLLAAGLASSLSASLELSGLGGRSSRDWVQGLAGVPLPGPQVLNEAIPGR